MTGIAEMFAELDGYERLEMTMAVRAVEMFERARRWRMDPDNRRIAVERVRRWRRDNPERYREQKRRALGTWRARNPEKVRELKRRYRERHPETVRAAWRRAQAARRARIKAGVA